MDTELLEMLNQLKTVEISKMKEIIIPNQLMMILGQEELKKTIHLNMNNLEIYKVKNVSDKCCKCNRPPKYLNNDSNQLLCWLHSVD